MELPEEFECVECGGRCVLVTRFEEGWGPEPGDIVVYRCTVCLHRFDVEVGEDE
jgi:rubredoxin